MYLPFFCIVSLLFQLFVFKINFKNETNNRQKKDEPTNKKKKDLKNFIADDDDDDEELFGGKFSQSKLI